MTYNSFDTACVHSGYSEKDAHLNQGALSCPIYATSTFVFQSSADFRGAVDGTKPAYLYSRCSNPTNSVGERRMAELDHCEEGCVFSSGIGAIAAVFWTFLSAGSHLICSNMIYGCTMGLVRSGLTRFGVEVTFVNTSNIDEVKNAIRPNTRMIFFETCANPKCSVTDVKAISTLAHAHATLAPAPAHTPAPAPTPGILVVADNTFCTPYIYTPSDDGANLVVHSLTKACIGTGTALAGIVLGSTRLIERVREEGRKDLTGAVLDPHSGLALVNGLKTLHIRMKQHCRAAERLARALERELDGGRIKALHVPTLPSSQYYEVAKRQFGGKTVPVIAFELNDMEQTAKFMDELKLCRRAVSLGDAETLVCCPAISTHAGYTPEERAQFGIPDGLVRVSVGLEDEDDIIADILQAIEASRS